MQGSPLDIARARSRPATSASATPRRPRVDAPAYIAIHLIGVPLLLVVLAWQAEYGTLDMAISQLFVDSASHAFRWRDSILLDVVGHQAARGLPVLAGGIALAAALATALADAGDPRRHWTAILVRLAAALMLGPLIVSLLKGMTTQHCPIDLLAFGGVIDYAADQAAPFWARSAHSAGHCLPSGHASGGYALVALYFAGWASGRPAWRWSGLAIGIGAGLVFSAVRIAQGAHFASATFWSAAVVWTVSAALFMPLLCRRSTAQA